VGARAAGALFVPLQYPFDRDWQGRPYAIKQVAPVVAEETDRIVVVTVYTFYF